MGVQASPDEQRKVADSNQDKQRAACECGTGFALGPLAECGSMFAGRGLGDWEVVTAGGDLEDGADDEADD